MFLCSFSCVHLFCLQWMGDCWLLFVFLCQVQNTFLNLCVYSDILCVFFQLKMSIRQPSHPKKSSAMEGCETHPTAHPKWWGKRCRFCFSQPFKSGGSQMPRRDQKRGRERLQRETLLMVRWWEFGWMGGGKLRAAEGGGKQLCEEEEDEEEGEEEGGLPR